MTPDESELRAMTDEKCPFCGTRKFYCSHRGQVRYGCGTLGPIRDESGEEVYETGTVCDKDVFRDGFLRCREIIDELAALDYKPNIPDALWAAIQEESKQ